MPRDYRLINFNGEWQVCSKARRGHGERIVWIYGKERIYFCDVGRECAVYQLPGSEKENFFGDRFNFSIDEVYPEDGRRMERLGGMNNVVAAQRAFTELLSHHSKRTRLQLRQGSFVMRDEFGKDDYRERVQIEAKERRRLKGGTA
ncbi:hypothetical protein [Rhizobium sp. 11515TR]|uniref:hypothetical protein n=1 Tax=Rhizobium sp. 11515TR TaxID=2028343 RepID=UPI000BA8B2A8|nr:hypothetical protein [Rhizobium sp. 11515TR]ASW06326.1 hypothetical protein CKA34_10810 [Rhizobium sp. 11515TR]